MDQKSWLWKKRSSEKTLVADKATHSLSKDEEETEVQKLLTEKMDLERDLRILNEKLSSALSECNAKDYIAKKQVKIAEEAIAGWEKAETEAVSLKLELDKVLQQKAASEERTGHLDAALKECMQQLRFVRDEQQKRVNSAAEKTSEEFEKIRIGLDRKLEDAGKRVAKLEAENAKLTKALSGKNNVIEDLGKCRTQVEAELKALMLRVESTEKENASLRYEVRVLEKELDIHNEEREFNCRIADVAQMQQQDSAKRIATLEKECQQLRLLVQKRLPGPAMLAKMKSEVETLGKVQVGTRRRKSNPCPDVEKPSQYLKEHFLAASSDADSDDKASCAESWASALISELEHFKNEKELRTLSLRNMGNPEMNLMDDFAEMEKLAVVSVDYPAGSSHHSSEEGNAVVQISSDKSLNLDASDARKGNSILTTEKSGEKFEPNVSMSVQKVLELLEGINIQSQDNGVAEYSSRKDDKILSYKNSDTPMGYIVRVFQWKGSELSVVLQQFVRTCNELLNGKADLEQFVQQVASHLEWIINHCFSIQDVSSMKDAIRNHLDWDESGGESEADGESDDLMSGHNSSGQMKALQSPRSEEFKTWNVEWADKESLEVDLEGCPKPEMVSGECFMIQLQESKGIIENLQSEMVTMEQSQEKFSNHIEKQRMIKEDLETQLMEASHEWRKACERISHLENELEKKSNSSKRLQETCHELKIQLQSVTSKDVSDNGNHREKPLQSDWEIAAASEKLADCQETILNLGKQLKALASPSDAALFDKVISTTANSVITSLSTPSKNLSRRSSLLNKMLAEDTDPHGTSTDIRRVNQNGERHSAVSSSTAMENSFKSMSSNGINHEEKSITAVASLDIVPCKKNGGRSFFKKLFWRQKKGNSDKAHRL